MGNRVTIVGHRDLHDAFFRPRNDVLNPSEVYRFMKPVFGPGVVYDAEPVKMREQLGFVADKLGQHNLVRFVPIIQEECRDYLQKHWGDSGTVNLIDAMGALLIGTASRCLLGQQVRELVSPERLAYLLGEIEAGINPVAVFIHWLPSLGLFRQQRARREFVEIAEKILDDRRKNPTAETDIVSGLLEAVYRDGTPMSDHERVGILLGVLFAGQHTSLIASSWTLMYLASCKSHLNHIRAEMEAFSDDGHLDFAGLEEMKFTAACFNETLRLHPPLIMLMRKVLEPLNVNGYTVPRGDILAVSPLASHRSQDVYSSPDTWMPSRWLEGEEGKGKYDMIGFGGGAHRCLGERFGRLQTRVVVATILNDYDIEIVGGSVPDPDYTTMVVGPTKSKSVIRYRRRTQAFYVTRGKKEKNCPLLPTFFIVFGPPPPFPPLPMALRLFLLSGFTPRCRDNPMPLSPYYPHFLLF
eukprot:Sspe_Gene.2435::Locus_811_Transcript_1_1_Confidence_1.000_Length_1671::g.2435::m.2435/K05917/CYP51; sterol 14-demethylase